MVLAQVKLDPFCDLVVIPLRLVIRLDVRIVKRVQVPDVHLASVASLGWIDVRGVVRVARLGGLTGASDGRRGRANRELDILGHPGLVVPLERLEVPRDEVSVQHESLHRRIVVIDTVRHHPDVPSRRAPADGPARARVRVDRLAPNARAALALARLSLGVRLAVLDAKLAQAPPRLRVGRATGFADGVDSKASRAPRVSRNNLPALRRR